MHAITCLILFFISFSLSMNKHAYPVGNYFDSVYQTRHVQRSLSSDNSISTAWSENFGAILSVSVTFCYTWIFINLRLKCYLNVKMKFKSAQVWCKQKRWQPLFYWLEAQNGNKMTARGRELLLIRESKDIMTKILMKDQKS